MSPTEFLLLLHSVPHIGDKALARLLRLASQQRLTAAAFLAMDRGQWQSQWELHPDAAAALDEQRDSLVERSAELARTLRTHEIQLISVESATYPPRLIRNEDAPPPLLYAIGALPLLDLSYTAERFTFTIAVSNGAAADVLDRLDALAAELSGSGGIPVTGHDRAPYQRLALAAQRRNNPVVYVMDRGLREALGTQFDRPPFAAARIRDHRFDRARDLALSPFRLDDHSLGANNRKRDSLVFALSDVIIAMDVRAGGAMHDACARAARQKRLVYVCDDGRDGNAGLRAEGCRTLPTGPHRVAEIRRALGA